MPRADLAAVARANAAAADSRRPRERIEDRIELSAVERDACLVIRCGHYPRPIVDHFTAEPVLECGWRHLSKWQLAADAVIDGSGFQQIAAWYRITPGTVERHVREALAAWADWREAGIARAAE